MCQMHVHNHCILAFARAPLIQVCFSDYDVIGPKSAAYLRKIARGELDLVKDLEESADHQEEDRERINKKVLSHSHSHPPHHFTTVGSDMTKATSPIPSL